MSNTIRRVHHERDFVTIGNDVARDGNLTLRARGLLVHMLSLPLGWEFSAARLSEEMIEGVDAIRGAMKELKDHGHLAHVKERVEGGRFRTVTYVAEDPSDLQQLLEDGSTGPGESSSGVTRANGALSLVRPEPANHTPGEGVLKERTERKTKDVPPAARARNLHFDAIQEAWPTAKGSFVGKTLATIRAVSPDVTPEEITARIAYMRTLEWGAHASMQALADHWSELRAEPAFRASHSWDDECRICGKLAAVEPDTGLRAGRCAEHRGLMPDDMAYRCGHGESPDGSGVCADPDCRARFGEPPLDVIGDDVARDA